MSGHPQGEGGIDQNSGVEDVEDALGRVGMALETSAADGTWQARALPLEGGDRESQLVGEGRSEDEAARAVWQRYVALQDGIGTS
jgi:hypothetical protein